MKLIIIANRLPLTIVQEKEEYKVIPSTGGLSTGLDSLETKMDKHWIGWPGMYIDDCKEKEVIDEQLEEQDFHPVYLSPDQIENYYEGYSNSVLWPLCHYFSNYMRYENKYWEDYKEVNNLFCEAALEIIEPGDIVWVQDYQLMLLPKMIRDRVSDISIGYFHHIPFPSYELFRGLPERAEILNGLLGADLVAFHTHSYMRHFISAVYRVLKLDCQLDEIQMDRRVVDVDAFPMGINYNMFHDALLNQEIKKNANELRINFGTGKLILSVDRLDYSKGIMIRLKSFEEFLENHPEYIGKVSLVMIVAPSRDNVDIYAELKNEIDMKVGAINGKYSSINWTPVYYFYRAFGFEELAALYHIADIALVTPLRDGMNLVAKEYVATKRDEPGILILSEMAGASIELSDAIIVNPTDIKEIESAIVHALEMPAEEQLETITAMQEIISTQTVKQWAKDFIEELTAIKSKNDALQQKIVEKKNFDIIKQRYDNAKNRLIILDYDGTLAPFHKEPMLAFPTPDLLNILEDLSADTKNHIVISSGRNKETLDKWLGHLPTGLAAEHGAFYKEEGIWHQTAQNIEWDDEIPEIIRQTVKRTPRSKMEVKDTALVWHYRNVDVWLADLRVTQLINALLNPCARHNLQIMKGNKIVEVKYNDISKGSEANRLINKGNYDFVMAIGDDTTDEEMFMALPPEAITIKVGQSSNAALYNLPTQQETLLFLLKLLER
ncbi:bifunctional alpha,alpha-trehalose-phosphate synthase (UDP-forming)/trehalose-phosphatase [Dysgonomonas sp. 216]|uniref:bifunctional alpha,alpha-trehalose-phosphate synthase (UDP-forming)/trehalose-phosphatase n=1 Tax=Dysgonomonas sp. 216 TaxID=2302934 RepID=UPI0013D8A6C7|nr:bifunctional alpha,alpha-trehalose-phosphate synthase (UDP-forming)/trehalose-phosphatase [Dysgonomonas sp. 216]NDW18750.1 bifunctional alpha,alpha-trehalose-phosphate synthase (UDP-forming)/trehalose-phosphatase [Dysgonomonas sp. 216]